MSPQPREVDFLGWRRQTNIHTNNMTDIQTDRQNIQENLQTLFGSIHPGWRMTTKKLEEKNSMVRLIFISCTISLCVSIKGQQRSS